MISRQLAARGAVCILFFFSTLWLVADMPAIFNSPDENAAYQFVQSIILSEPFQEPFNIPLEDTLYPRSVLSLSGEYAPRSFLGLIVLYGAIGKVLSVVNLGFFVLMITPILALLAAFAWRGIVEKLFKDHRLAEISMYMLMLHPAWWYYSARTMMHNVAFVSLLIFGAWFLVAKPLQTSIKNWKSFNIDTLLAGCMVGLALAFRASEVIWIGVALLVFAALFIKRGDWTLREPLFIAAGAFLALVPFGLFNLELYGGFFTTGYTVDGISSAVSSYEGSSVSNSAFMNLFQFFFPFGIHELAILRHVWSYGFWLYPWMSLLALIGIGGVLIDWKNTRATPGWKTLLITTFVLALWLGVVYGSWKFHDNPDPFAVTLANSYVRYWLPLFLLASPFAARGLLSFFSRVKSKRRKGIWVYGAVGAIAILSAWSVFSGDDGLYMTRVHLLEFEEKKEAVLASTEKDSIIIVDRADKFLWPNRAVRMSLRDETTYALITSMVEVAPLYYFGITLPQKDMDFLNEEQLLQYGVQIEEIETVQNETLYRIFSP